MVFAQLESLNARLTEWSFRKRLGCQLDKKQRVIRKTLVSLFSSNEERSPVRVG